MSSLLIVAALLALGAAQQIALRCDEPTEHVTLLAFCGKLAMKYDEAGDKFAPVPNSAATACGSQVANRNVAVCAALPEAAGKFAAGSITLSILNFGWFWACTDVARSQNCSQVKGVYVDCWFSSIATPPKDDQPSCSFPSTESIGLNFQSSLPRLPPNVATDYRTPCTRQSAPGLYCAGGSMLVRCEDMAVAPVLFTLCPNGCKTNPPGVSDECNPPDATFVSDGSTSTVRSSASRTTTIGDGSSSSSSTRPGDTTRIIDSTQSEPLDTPPTISKPPPAGFTGSLVINEPSPVGEVPSIVPVVVGAVIGAIVAIVLVVLFVWYVKMRRSRYHRDGERSSAATVMMSRAPSMQTIPNQTVDKNTGDYSSAPPPTYAGERMSATVGGRRPPSRYETAPPLEDQRYETAPPDARYDHAAPEQEERVMF